MSPRPILALALLGAAAASSALAQEAPRAAAFQAVLDCRSQSDDARRLACYDAAAGRMAAAETKGEIVVIDQAKAREARRQAFGLSLPSLDFLSRGLKAEEADQIEGVVKTASADAYGNWTIWLESGAKWRQIAPDFLSRNPKPGSKVVIKRAAIGSFKMNVDGQPAIRVRREE